MSAEMIRAHIDRESLRELVREILAEELEPIRELLIRPVGEPTPEVSELVGAAEVAKLIGEDVSTPKRRKASAQKVYNLARQNLIPSVRISPRRVRFDPAAVRRCFAEGGVASPYATGSTSPENACALGRR